MSKNAEGWIRHRAGRKCPVEAGVRVDYRLRSKKEAYGERAELLDWGLYNECPASDIMAYRLHKPAEHGIYADDKDESSEPVQVTYVDSDGPLQWRDRITEIDATTSALATERAELVQKLAGEGFALIRRVADATACQPDPGRWMIGDSVECVSSNYSFITVGTVYVITGFDRNMVQFLDDDGTEMEYERANFKFHSSQSA